MFNGVNLPNATNASLTLNAIGATNCGNYVVCVTNTFNTVMSIAATLGLETPLHFLSPRTAADGLHLSLSGPSGTNYVIECSTDFALWIPLATNRAQTGFADYVDFSATNRLCFYRARPVP